MDKPIFNKIKETLTYKKYTFHNYQRTIKKGMIWVNKDVLLTSLASIAEERPMTRPKQMQL